MSNNSEQAKLSSLSHFDVHKKKVRDLAISRANLTAVVGFRAPLLLKNAQRSPCITNGKLIIKDSYNHFYFYSYSSIGFTISRRILIVLVCMF